MGYSNQKYQDFQEFHISAVRTHSDIPFLKGRIIWNHYNKFHQSMSGVENNSQYEPSAVIDNIFAQNQTIDFLQSSYSGSVCWLFETIQNLMVNQQLETTRSYLFYIKYLLDHHLKNTKLSSFTSLHRLDQQLNLIIQIFLQKISNEKLKSDYPFLFQNIQGAGAFEDYPSFQNTQNPFEMLQYLQPGLDKRQAELAAELMVLACTTKQFYCMQAGTIFAGCIQSIKEYKGWSFDGDSDSPLLSPAVKLSKSLFHDLLMSIEKI